MAIRVPIAARIGLGLCLVGFCLPASWQLWIETRNWVPLDIPISLSQGHIRTDDFKINLESAYFVHIEVESGTDRERVACLLGVKKCESISSVLKATWTLYGDGGQIARGSSRPGVLMPSRPEVVLRGLGGFGAAEGEHFFLDLNVLEDGSALNAFHPRLMVEEDGGQYWRAKDELESLLIVGLVCVAVGGALFVSPFLIRRKARQWVTVSLAVSIPSQHLAPPERVAARHEFARRLCAYLGFGLLIFGIGAGWGISHWLATRTFVALERPVSLAAGHIRTGPFKINLRAWYHITIVADGWGTVDSNCPMYDRLKATWVLYRDGQPIRNWHESTEYFALGGFDGEEGTYDLDVDVSSDTGCLDARYPKLKIYAERWSYYKGSESWLWLSLICAIFGAGLLTFSAVARYSIPSTVIRITESPSIGQNFQWAQRLPLKPRFSVVPTFGIFMAVVCMLLMFAFLILAPIPFKGLYVRLLMPGHPAPGTDKWMPPLIVHIKDVGPGQRPALYVDSDPVSWDDLGKALKAELSRRPEWVVYVEGDGNVPAAVPLHVVDVAHGLRATVYLLTPKTELKSYDDVSAPTQSPLLKRRPTRKSKSPGSDPGL